MLHNLQLIKHDDIGKNIKQNTLDGYRQEKKGLATLEFDSAFRDNTIFVSGAGSLKHLSLITRRLVRLLLTDPESISIMFNNLEALSVKVDNIIEKLQAIYHNWSLGYLSPADRIKASVLYAAIKGEFTAELAKIKDKEATETDEAFAKRQRIDEIKKLQVHTFMAIWQFNLELTGLIESASDYEFFFEYDNLIQYIIPESFSDLSLALEENDKLEAVMQVFSKSGLAETLQEFLNDIRRQAITQPQRGFSRNSIYSRDSRALNHKIKKMIMASLNSFNKILGSSIWREDEIKLLASLVYYHKHQDFFSLATTKEATIMQNNFNNLPKATIQTIAKLSGNVDFYTLATSIDSESMYQLWQKALGSEIGYSRVVVDIAQILDDYFSKDSAVINIISINQAADVLTSYCKRDYDGRPALQLINKNIKLYGESKVYSGRITAWDDVGSRMIKLNDELAVDLVASSEGIQLGGFVNSRSKLATYTDDIEMLKADIAESLEEKCINDFVVGYTNATVLSCWGVTERDKFILSLAMGNKLLEDNRPAWASLATRLGIKNDFDEKMDVTPRSILVLDFKYQNRIVPNRSYYSASNTFDNYLLTDSLEESLLGADRRGSDAIKLSFKQTFSSSVFVEASSAASLMRQATWFPYSLSTKLAINIHQPINLKMLFKFKFKDVFDEGQSQRSSQIFWPNPFYCYLRELNAWHIVNSLIAIGLGKSIIMSSSKLKGVVLASNLSLADELDARKDNALGLDDFKLNIDSTSYSKASIKALAEEAIVAIQQLLDKPESSNAGLTIGNAISVNGSQGDNLFRPPYDTIDHPEFKTRMLALYDLAYHIEKQYSSRYLLIGYYKDMLDSSSIQSMLNEILINTEYQNEQTAAAIQVINHASNPIIAKQRDIQLGLAAMALTTTAISNVETFMDNLAKGLPTIILNAVNTDIVYRLLSTLDIESITTTLYWQYGLKADMFDNYRGITRRNTISSDAIPDITADLTLLQVKNMHGQVISESERKLKVYNPRLAENREKIIGKESAEVAYRD